MSVAFVPQCMYLTISIVSYFNLCLCVYILLSFSVLVCVYVLSLLMYYLYPDVSVWDKGNTDFVIRSGTQMRDKRGRSEISCHIRFARFVLTSKCKTVNSYEIRRFITGVRLIVLIAAEYFYYKVYNSVHSDKHSECIRLINF